MKKILALLLAMALVFTLAACAVSTSSESAGVTATTESVGQNGNTSIGADGTVTTEFGEAELSTDKEIPHFKILVCYATFTDKLGSQFKAAMEYLAKPLNLELTFLETGNGGDDALSAVQAALVNGYDGVLYPQATEAIAKVCADAGTMLAVYACEPASADLQKTLTDNYYDNYLGCVVLDDYNVMVEGVKALYDAGCRNVMWNGVPLGLSGAHDQRTFGFEDTVASYPDMKIITENYDTSTWADAIATTAATHPELDGVGCAALTEAIYNTVVSEGLTDSIKIAGIDISEGTGAAFEAGYLVFIAGGNYTNLQVAFANLYNYLLDGTRIIPDCGVLRWKTIDIHNIDEYNDFIKYVDSSIPAYTADEIMQMVHYFNPDITPESFAAEKDNFTLESIKERHAALFD